jgi:Leucine-rich repeat (LRR) protein
MKRIILHFALVLALLAVQIPAQATLVDIPDANFRAKLKTLYPSCFVGDQMETTCSGITSATSLDVRTLNITDLTGIQHFIGLKTLNCSLNQITNLSALPSGLLSLICSDNQLTNLPAVPSGVTNLNCSYNQLTNLSSLPIGLFTLNCTGNKLISLPSLPSGLFTLECSNNKLISLPPLPIGLSILSCSANQLTSLPSLPIGLNTLNCSNNQLTNLPVLPSGLFFLACPSNQLTSLPDLPNGLTFLSCGSNKLVSLPSLPNGITDLRCEGNQLTSLPALPNALTSLNCSSNKLISLPVLPSALTNLNCADNKLASLPNLPSGLTYLDCGTNQLTSLPSIPGGLFTLNCAANQLTSLPTLPSGLTYLYCGSNQLTSLPALPSGLINLSCSSNQLTSLPALPYGLEFLRSEINLLDFGDLEAISPKPPTYSITPQSYFILPAAQAITVGTNLVLDGTIGGSANQYQWYKNNALISGANSATFTQAAVTSLDAGTYKCVVTSAASNSTVTGVTITSSDVVITITKANQTITFSPLPSKSEGDVPFALSAMASSGLAVSYASSNTAVATVIGNTVTVLGSGTTDITASQTGDANYNAAVNVTQPFTITKANQTITFSPLPSKTLGDGSFALTATASSGLPVSYTSSNTEVATITGNTVTVVGVGVTDITASQAGDANYNTAANVVQSLTINALVTGIEQTDEDVKVFPNPMEDELVVDVTALHSATPVALVIYDLAGRAIHTTSCLGDVTIDVGSFQAGVYVLMIKTHNSVSMKKMIKK